MLLSPFLPPQGPLSLKRGSDLLTPSSSSTATTPYPTPSVSPDPFDDRLTFDGDDDDAYDDDDDLVPSKPVLFLPYRRPQGLDTVEEADRGNLDAKHAISNPDDDFVDLSAWLAVLEHGLKAASATPPIPCVQESKPESEQPGKRQQQAPPVFQFRDAIFQPRSVPAVSPLRPVTAKTFRKSSNNSPSTLRPTISINADGGRSRCLTDASDVSYTSCTSSPSEMDGLSVSGGSDDADCSCEMDEGEDDVMGDDNNNKNKRRRISLDIVDSGDVIMVRDALYEDTFEAKSMAFPSILDEARWRVTGLNEVPAAALLHAFTGGNKRGRPVPSACREVLLRAKAIVSKSKRQAKLSSSRSLPASPLALTKSVSQDAESGSLRHPCPSCSKTYTTLEGLRLHVRTYHEHDKPWTCTVPGCDSASFVRPADLRMHIIRVHAPTRPFPCRVPSCTKSLATYSELKRHVMKDHGDVLDALMSSLSMTEPLVVDGGAPEL